MDNYSEEIIIQKKKKRMKIIRITIEIIMYITSYVLVYFVDWMKFSYILYLLCGIFFAKAIKNEYIQRKAVKKAEGKHYFFNTTNLYFNDLRKIINEIILFDPERESDKGESKKNRLQILTGNMRFNNIDDLKASLYFGYTYFLAIVSPSETMSVIVSGNPQPTKENPSYTKIWSKDDSEEANKAFENIKKIIKNREIHIMILFIFNWLFPILSIFTFDAILSTIMLHYTLPLWGQFLFWILGIQVYIFIQSALVAPRFIDKVNAAEEKS